MTGRIKAIRTIVAAIGDWEPRLQPLSDFAAKTVEFKERLANGASLDDLLSLSCERDSNSR
jgi:preprotein translocase subunit SecA